MKIGIVGGGISGLYLAYRLSANSDNDVVLYEKESSIGGRIYTTKVADQIKKGAPPPPRCWCHGVFVSLVGVALRGSDRVRVRNRRVTSAVRESRRLSWPNLNLITLPP